MRIMAHVAHPGDSRIGPTLGLQSQLGLQPVHHIGGYDKA